MSFQVTIANQSYTLPETGDSLWGDQTSLWMAAISTQLLQKSGGNFFLTAEVDFGATFGTKQAYLKSRTANPATAGLVRMARTDGIGWRNEANDANILLEVNSSNRLTFGGAEFLTAVGTITANRVLISDGSGNIASSGVSTTTLGYLDATSSIQTQLNGKEASFATLSPSKGGTGVSNNNAATTTRSGNFALTLTLTNVTSVTLPTSGTLATLAGAETLASKTLTTPILNGVRNATAASKTGTYAALTTDYFVPCNAGSGGFTVSLPAASGNTGLTYVIKKTDSSFNAVTIDPNGSETIDGQTTTTLNTQNEALTIQCDGSNWQIIERRIPSAWISYTPAFSPGFGTVTLLESKWRRVGDSIEIRGRAVAGTTNASDMTIGLPSPLEHIYDDVCVETGNFISSFSTTVGTNTVPVINPAAPTIFYFGGGDNRNGFIPFETDDVVGTAESFSWTARAKILGWNG